jgi:hypothetical protein
MFLLVQRVYAAGLPLRGIYITRLYRRNTDNICAMTGGTREKHREDEL